MDDIVGNLRFIIAFSILLGDNAVEVTIHIGPSCNHGKLHSILPSEGKILTINEHKIVLRIAESLELAHFLDRMNEQSEELGVTNFTVSQLSLEQVFLK